MYALADWAEENQQAWQDHEALETMCHSILERTLRDIYTYRDCRTRQRKRIHEAALNWVLCWDIADRDQPMGFVWVCGILGWDPEKVARRVWELRQTDYITLKKVLREQDVELHQR